MMKRNGQVGIPIDPGDTSNVFTLYLPVSSEILSASFKSDNGDYFLLVHYMANEDNSNASFKAFHFETMRYTSSDDFYSKEHHSVHLCSIREGLYTYGVFYTP